MNDNTKNGVSSTRVRAKRVSVLQPCASILSHCCQPRRVLCQQTSGLAIALRVRLHEGERAEQSQS
jgi:hypothetical protein